MEQGATGESLSEDQVAMLLNVRDKWTQAMNPSDIWTEARSLGFQHPENIRTVQSVRISGFGMPKERYFVYHSRSADLGSVLTTCSSSSDRTHHEVSLTWTTASVELHIYKKASDCRKK